MFLNISNHASAKWSEAQLNAARKFGGEIKDVQFPNVSPGVSTEEVMTMAQSIVEVVINDEPGIAMVQGEFSLTFELSRMLLALGWQVVVATTERKVVEVANVKTTTFEFVQFRALRG
jgi:hypothetical protein